ncbi:MAG TPA: hypothetical protein VHZ50_05405, partial [Puia sp.]|nr:hypothetical protein [Puia sp.]
MFKPYRLTAIIISILKYCPAFITTLFFFNSFAQPYTGDSKITYASTLDYLNKEKDLAINDSTPFVIGEIHITGNKKTKSYIIERELSF